MNLLVYQNLFHLKLYYAHYREIYIITIYYFSPKIISDFKVNLLSNVQHEYSKLLNIQKINY